jgi:hypothetical protein
MRKDEENERKKEGRLPFPNYIRLPQRQQLYRSLVYKEHNCHKLGHHLEEAFQVGEDKLRLYDKHKHPRNIALLLYGVWDPSLEENGCAQARRWRLPPCD